MQPNPTFFYKTFLELDGANMVSILAFDSGSMKVLLGEHNSQYFSEQYPIIYKNKIPKKTGKEYYYRTAIDNALRNNQVESVNLLVKYIVTYQNNFVSSYLFLKALPVMLEKSISVLPLLDSKVFYMEFDYDEWPSNHTNNSFEIRAYHESIFTLRHHYRTVFPEKDFEEMDERGKVDTSKVYKIKYSLNLLPLSNFYITGTNTRSFFNEDVLFSGLCSETEELEIFSTHSVSTYLDYKWMTYTQSHHYLGFIMHVFYTATILAYVNKGYL